jgi:cytochrome c oxidase subunit 4
VVYGLMLLGAVTLVEVFISLLGKGHIIDGLEKYNAVLYTAGLIIAVLSLYKAYFIIYEFMHMKYEVKSLAMTVLLPTALLIWAIIAFFQEGDSWKSRRQQIKEKNELPTNNQAPVPNPQGMLTPTDTYKLENWF